MKIDTPSYFLKFSAPRPYKANGWTSAENWHVGLFLKFITPRRLHKAVPVIYEQSWHIESLFWSLNVLPPSPPNQFGILSHCYVFFPLSPTKTLRSTYKTIWHHKPSCLRCLFLPLEIITLKIWTKWRNVIILIFVNSFSYSKPICWTCEEHWHLEPFLTLTSPDPTKQ